MKKHQSYWVLLLALLFCSSAQAKVDNYFGVSVNAGEWTMLPSGSQYTGSIGGAAGVGAVYELRAGALGSPTHFLFDVGLGAWGGLTNFSQTAGDMSYRLEKQLDLTHTHMGHPSSHPLIDPSTGKYYDCVFDYVYELKGRQDRYANIAAQLPIMIGFEHRRFYMLVGAKVNVNVWTRDFMTATLNTYGDYSPYHSALPTPFTNQPEYQFWANKSVKRSVETKLNFDVDASIEIGGRIGGTVADAVGFDVPKDRVEYRLAVFADYGLLDLHSAGLLDGISCSGTYDIDPASPTYVYNPYLPSGAPGTNESMLNPKNMTIDNLMSIRNFADKVSNLMVGIKFTVLFRMPEPRQCIICPDSYVSTAGRLNVRGSGVKYEE